MNVNFISGTKMPRRRRKNTILPGKTRKQREADKIRSRARYNKRRKKNWSLEETDTSVSEDLKSHLLIE